MKKSIYLLLSLCLCLSLSGCSLLNFLFSGCGSPDADLVVINDSTRSIGSLSLEYEDHSTRLADATYYALLEQGESYGLQLEEDCTSVTLLLLDTEGSTLCRRLLEVEEGVRLYATLREDLCLEVGTDWPAAAETEQGY